MMEVAIGYNNRKQTTYHVNPKAIQNNEKDEFNSKPTAVDAVDAVDEASLFIDKNR